MTPSPNFLSIQSEFPERAGLFGWMLRLNACLIGIPPKVNEYSVAATSGKTNHINLICKLLPDLHLHLQYCQQTWELKFVLQNSWGAGRRTVNIVDIANGDQTDGQRENEELAIANTTVASAFTVRIISHHILPYASRSTEAENEVNASLYELKIGSTKKKLLVDTLHNPPILKEV